MAVMVLFPKSLTTSQDALGDPAAQELCSTGWKKHSGCGIPFMGTEELTTRLQCHGRSEDAAPQTEDNVLMGKMPRRV